MHRCLAISEILFLVFSPLPKHTLADVARTCQPFYYPAIRCLWRELPSILPIFCILSTKRWVSICKGKVQDLQITNQNAQRFGLYARHVKIINCPRKFHVSYHLLNQLRESDRLSHPLFPMLKQATLPSDFSATTVFYPGLILSASVRSIMIYAHPVPNWAPSSNGTYWDAVCGRVEEFSDSLTTFALTTDICFDGTRFNPIRDNAFLNGLFPTFSSSLRSLDVSCYRLTRDALLAVSRLSGLESLRMLTCSPSTPTFEAPLNFPALTNLHIQTNNMKATNEILIQLKGPKLRSFRIQCTFSPEPLGLTSTFTHLSGCDAEELSEIVVELLGTSGTATTCRAEIEEYEDTRYGVAGETLKPLLRFNNLSVLRISPCNSQQITDEDFLQMCSAWPELKVLELNDQTLYLSPCGITMGGVHLALQNCPRLEELVLRFNGRKDMPPFDDDSKPHPALRRWDVCTSSIRSGRRFAKWAMREYPLLKEISFYGLFQAGIQEEREYKQLDHSLVTTYLDAAMMLDRWKDVPPLLKQLS
ncbi:hypothetical protein FA15DRAFT_437073 [Coprinopsis marcescibilis]|uniref:F-box domain-containing protein n=1 Tax=Coprinopsis marcescibilis TaxID=230819 RepID=A0A5C3KUJ2_COPMA|nr:hypothetical protein FA15DRAFT_437073 [Coprinopsis marcescibilis]